MKKNGSFILAVILVFVQVFSLFCVLSVSTSAITAEKNSQDRNYVFYQAGEESLTLDGAADELFWSKVPYSEPFAYYVVNNASSSVEASAKFKGAWKQEGDDAYLYFLLEIEDETVCELNAWNGDTFMFGISEDGTAADALKDVYQESTQKLENFPNRKIPALAYRAGHCPGGLTHTTHTAEVGCSRGAEYWFRYAVQEDRATGSVVVEIQCKFSNLANAVPGHRFCFDLMVQDNVGDKYNRLYWNGSMAGSGMGGDGIARMGNGVLSDVKAGEQKSSERLIGFRDAEGNLYPVNTKATVKDLSGVWVDFETVKGASVRFSNPTGIRWESRFDKASYDAVQQYIQATGTLILPSDYLAWDAFTTEALDAKEIQYENVVNDGWENRSSAEADGYYRYYGAIAEVQEGNLSREFSGIGYFTVLYADGTTANFYGGYDAELHSRSVEQVVTAALADTTANWSEEQIRILKALWMQEAAQ